MTFSPTLSPTTPTSPTSPVSPARRLRRSPSGELEELFSHLAASGDEQIYYSDFLAATMEARSRMREEAVRAAFRRLDADDSGLISVEDFQSVIGETFEGIDVEQIVKEVDTNGAGGISSDAFLRVLEDRDEVPQPANEGSTLSPQLCAASPARSAFLLDVPPFPRSHAK